eukprot:12354597-Karenia_brevis.AAC.1
MADVDTIAEAIKTFSKHSGGGLSGLRPTHLKQSLVPSQADNVLEHFCNLVNLLSRGEAHAA